MTRRRSSPRVQMRSLSAEITLKRSLLSLGKREQVRVLDIGPGGMGFWLERPVDVGTRCSFSIPFDPDVRVRGQGIIKNCRQGDRGGYVLGMEFTRLAGESLAFLADSKNILMRSGSDILDQAIPVGEKLSMARRSLGLTLVELSSISGVPLELLHRIENGQEDPPPSEALTMLASSLGIRFSAILHAQLEPKPEEPE